MQVFNRTRLSGSMSYRPVFKLAPLALGLVFSCSSAGPGDDDSGIPPIPGWTLVWNDDLLDLDMMVKSEAELRILRYANRAVEDIAPLIIGEDPSRIEHLWQMMYRQHFWHGNGIVRSTAISLI